MPHISSTRIKVVSLSILIFLVTVFSVLIDFINAKFLTEIFTNAAYWINVVSVQSAVMVLIFVARSLAKEKEMSANKLYATLQDALQNAYASINSCNLNGTFRDYIAQDNRARKLRTYKEHLSAKIAKYADKARKNELIKGRIETIARTKKKTAHGFRYNLCKKKITVALEKKLFWEEKLAHADEDIDFIKIRFVKYSYSIIFNDSKDREAEEDDPATHESRDIIAILLTKGLGIFAFGVIATSYIVFDTVFSIGMVLKAVVKLLQIVLGLFMGAVAGQDFIRHKMCAKLTIRANYVKQFMEKQKNTAVLQ